MKLLWKFQSEIVTSLDTMGNLRGVTILLLDPVLFSWTESAYYNHTFHNVGCPSYKLLSLET